MTLGCCRDSKSLCVVFGHFSFKSDLALDIKKETSEDAFLSASDDEKDTEFEDALEDVPSEAEKSKQELLNKVIEASYIKYKLNLEQVQILFTQNSDQMTLSYIKETQQSDSYVLTPVDLYLNFHQCIYVDDVKLPVLKLFGNLPILHIDMSDQKILLLKRILSSLAIADDAELDEEVPELSLYASSQYDDLSGSVSDSGDLDMLDTLDFTNQGVKDMSVMSKLGQAESE